MAGKLFAENTKQLSGATDYGSFLPHLHITVFVPLCLFHQRLPTQLHLRKHLHTLHLVGISVILYLYLPNDVGRHFPHTTFMASASCIHLLCLIAVFLRFHRTNLHCSHHRNHLGYISSHIRNKAFEKLRFCRCQLLCRYRRPRVIFLRTLTHLCGHNFSIVGYMQIPRQGGFCKQRDLHLHSIHSLLCHAVCAFL